MDVEEFVARRMVGSQALQTLRDLRATGFSLVGGGPSRADEVSDGGSCVRPFFSLSLPRQLCQWAAKNTRGATLVDTSPRFARDRAQNSLKGGFGAQLCFAQEHLAVGAVLYHYDVSSNIGTVLDLVSALSVESRASRAQALRMVRVLLDQMVSAMDEEAVLNGQLAGCNAVFLVSRGSRDPHRMLAALKCFCLDFPLQRFMGDAPPEGLALGLMLTQQVPLTPVAGSGVGDGGRFYVPAIVLERFFRLQASLGALVGLDLQDSLATQLTKLSVRSKIQTTAWARELKVVVPLVLQRALIPLRSGWWWTCARTTTRRCC